MENTVEASESTGEEETVDLDLTAFCTDGEYRYKGIPWLASLEEAEETLGVSLEPMMEGMNTKMGSFVAPAEFRGESGYISLGLWLASLEEAEETLGVSLEPMMEGMNTKMGSFVAPAEFRGESGYISLGLLNDGVTDISFWFGTDTNNKDKYDGDLTELSDYVLEQFTELYGEPDEVYKNGFFRCSGRVSGRIRVY